MPLERVFAKLALRPQSVCRECRRTVVTATSTRQQRTATEAFTESLQAASREEAVTRPAQQPVPTFGQSRTELAQQTVRNAFLGREQSAAQREADMQATRRRADLESQMPRRWTPGDVYAPHDLSGVEMSKWKKMQQKPRQRRDILDRLEINPLDHYKNFSMMSEYMSETGRIKHSQQTGLRPVNQRRMAKAIRRAIGVGLIPAVHRHPQLILRDMQRRRG